MGTSDAVSPGSGWKWLTGRQSERASGRNMHSILREALAGNVRHMIEPGGLLRFWSEDVAKLAK